MVFGISDTEPLVQLPQYYEKKNVRDWLIAKHAAKKVACNQHASEDSKSDTKAEKVVLYNKKS